MFGGRGPGGGGSKERVEELARGAREAFDARLMRSRLEALTEDLEDEQKRLRRTREMLDFFRQRLAKAEGEADVRDTLRQIEDLTYDESAHVSNIVILTEKIKAERERGGEGPAAKP